MPMVDDVEARLGRGLNLIAGFFHQLAERPQVGCVFRGHADANWPLAPSASRSRVVGIDKMPLLRTWQARASRFASPRPTDELEWLALAQHYGIPTTLLDWTTNPLIALFFASGEPFEVEGCVWRVSRSAFDTFASTATVKVFKTNRIRPGLVDAVTMNARSAAQDSAMSIHSPSTVFEPATEHGGIVFRINADDKDAVRIALGELGLTEARLFADLGVVVRNFQSHLSVLRLMEAGLEAQRLAEAALAIAPRFP